MLNILVTKFLNFHTKKESRIELPGGWLARVMTMKAMEAARAVLRASQPGPKTENANTPMAAQPI